MEVVAPEKLPDPDADREAMEAQQRSIADAAVFSDAFEFDPARLTIDEPITIISDAASNANSDGPIVVGVDQAFTDDAAISAAVAIRGGRVIERSVERAQLRFPYIPGLLAFREAGAIVEALRGLSANPALLVLDGSGRIHYRQAGIATHVGVLFDVPAIGVAKSLLCGTPARSLDDPLPAGTRVPILADQEVDAPPGTHIGDAYQSRQFPRPNRRHVNPLIVSPGHRLRTTTATDLIAALGAGYKLPEPTRLADRIVDQEKSA